MEIPPRKLAWFNIVNEELGGGSAGLPETEIL